MQTELCLKDPVFQLNILLWMAKEQPRTGYTVRPLFFEWGFAIVYIENPFPLPDTTVQKVQDSGLNITIQPEPDLVLGRQTDGKALYLEAKANSFGPDREQAKQARGHLLAAGPVFREVLAPLQSCLLCYVIPAQASQLMGECLTTLTDQLVNAGLAPGQSSVHGLAFDGSRIVYSWDAPAKTHLGIEHQETVVMDGVSEDTNPAPLLIVFSDEDCATTGHGDFYREAMIAQVRACLLCDLHNHGLSTRYETTPDELLKKTTDGIFDYLGRQKQKGLRRLVRENVFKRIINYWKDKQSGVELIGDVLTITWQVNGEKIALLDWLEDRQTKFDPRRPTDENEDGQLPLSFDGIPPSNSD